VATEAEMGSSLSSGASIYGHGKYHICNVNGHKHVGLFDGFIAGVVADILPYSSQIQMFFNVVCLSLFNMVGFCWISYRLVQGLIWKITKVVPSWVIYSLGVWRPNAIALLLALVVEGLVGHINQRRWSTGCTTRYPKKVNGIYVDMPLEPSTKRQQMQKLRQSIGYYLVAAFSDPWNAFLLSTLLRYDLDRRFYANDLKSAISIPYSSTTAITRPATLVQFWSRESFNEAPNETYWCGFEIRYKLDGMTYIKKFLGYHPLETTFETAEGTHLWYTLQQQGLPMDVKILPKHPRSALPVFLLDQAFFELAPSSRKDPSPMPIWLTVWRMIEIPLYAAICLYSGFYMYHILSAANEYGSCWWKLYLDVGLFCLGVVICLIPISYSDDCQTIVQQGQGSLYGFLDMTCRQEKAASQE